MDVARAIGIAKEALPWIGAAATGNVPVLVAMAAKAVGDAIGVEVAPNGPAVAQAVASASPEQRLALASAENAFAVTMRDYGYKEAADLLADVKNAREREIKVGDNTNRVLAYLIVAAFIGMVLATLMGWTKAESVMAGTLIGYLSAKADQVLSYYFGNNKQNDRKTELLAQADAVKNPK